MNNNLHTYNKIITSQGSAPTNSGYYSNYMESGGTVVQKLFSIINYSLDLPFQDIKAVTDVFKQAGIDKRATANPSAYHMALSNVPLTQHTTYTSPSGTTGDEDDVATREVANPNYTCLALSGRYTPLGVKTTSKFLSYLVTRYGVQGATEIRNNTKDNLEIIIRYLTTLSTFIKTCVCDKFGSCGTAKPSGASGSSNDQWSCVLGETILEQSAALSKPGTNEPRTFTEIIKQFSGPNCGVSITAMMTYYQSLVNNGKAEQGEDIWSRMDAYYVDAVQNSYGWNDPQGERINAIVTFNVFVASLCKVYLYLSSVIKSYKQIFDTISTDPPTDSDTDSSCHPWRAIKAICQWMMVVHGEQMPQGGFAKGIPSYLLTPSAWSAMNQCAKSGQDARPCADAFNSSTPLGTAFSNFSWQDIGLPLSGHPTR